MRTLSLNNCALSLTLSVAARGTLMGSTPWPEGCKNDEPEQNQQRDPRAVARREMTVLSGAHTISQGQCNFFRNRIYNESNIDPSFSATRRATCPVTSGDTNLAPLDPTPNKFDNTYYQVLVVRRGLFHSDHQELFNGGSQDAMVRTYSSNMALFFRDFASAMVKMSSIAPHWVPSRERSERIVGLSIEWAHRDSLFSLGDHKQRLNN